MKICRILAFSVGVQEEMATTREDADNEICWFGIYYATYPRINYTNGFWR
jgi:hypothetical protein